MYLVLQNIKKLENILNGFMSNHKIKNYMLTIGISMEIYVKLHVAEEDNNLIDSIFEKDTTLQANAESISIEQISEKEYSQDYIRLSFKEQPKPHPNLNYNLRRRFHDLLNLQSHTENNPCPVVTFYSYKGGVGRTTALTCYAQYLANRGKEVIIIDCDFEAPGFTNYFGYRFGNETQAKHGIIEYLLDRQFLLPQGQIAIKEKLITKLASEYSYQVGNEYLSKETKGKIRVIKAGNYESSNLDNYLEGLARLDIGNIALFQDFLGDLQKGFGLSWDNSVILIDSRTGFNDTFATLCSISNLVVGVFGTNTQSQTGLQYILDLFYSQNSPLKGKFQSLFLQSFSVVDTFKNELATVATNFFSENKEKFGEETPSDEIFIPFPEISILKKIGESTTVQEEEEAHYNRLAKNQELIEVFQKIDTRIEGEVKKKEPDEQKHTIKTTIEVLPNLNIAITATAREILNNMEVPPPRAENISLTEKIENYYLRQDMVGIFNWDKFIISGSKGTGKTFLYETMENPWVQKELCSLAGTDWENYLFVNLIPVLEPLEGKEQINFISSENFADYETIPNFYNKFWVVFSANLLFNKQKIKNFIDQNNLDIDTSWRVATDLKPLEYANKLAILLKDTDKLIHIERQLTLLDKYLASTKKELLIFYDQLDHFVSPPKWRTWISSLVKYWRSNPFTNIQPKIFLRSDLLRTQIEAVNSTEIARRTIKIEWTGDELFAYFFSIQFKKHRDTLLAYFLANDLPQSTANIILDRINNKFDIPVDKEILTPLVDIYFGKSAHRTNPNDFGYGETYSWFAKNLEDGQNDLSLRPFIWLLKIAKAKAEKDSNYEYNSKNRRAILSATYFADFKTMEKVGEKYYEDLVKEQGNYDLLTKFQYFLRHTQKIRRAGEYTLQQWEELVSIFIVDSNLNNEITVKSFTSFLSNNGIIREQRVMGGKHTNYQIPFLYKYYLFFDNK